ncbi:MAG: Glu/Leu/Phe/Val dehydrogenase [Firmicutes bacterium]|nr:Glu/Leu/Phe/Val dehydrogenase [Bacillota bacterium]
MEVFKEIGKYGHEQVAYCFDEVSGLKSIIAIHNTSLGPALGGCRMWPYGSEEEAVEDVLRLSRAMTYKNSIMGLDLGGGKAVIIGDPRKDKTEALFRAFGKFVQSLGGRYITAEDVGVGERDMAVVATETGFVAGRPEVSGDPSPATAWGVLHGMKACCRVVFGDDSLAGRKVAVQGAGHVGRHLIRHLVEEEAEVVVTDIFEDAVESVVTGFNVRAVDPQDIYDVECDVFSPCALGGVINDGTIPRLRCRIVAGAANNQLAESHHGEELARAGILYAPDFVMNGGGVTNCAAELRRGSYNRKETFERISRIYDILLRVFETARARGIAPHRAAEQLAEERINTLSGIKRLYLRAPVPA